MSRKRPDDLLLTDRGEWVPPRREQTADREPRRARQTDIDPLH